MSNLQINCRLDLFFQTEWFTMGKFTHAQYKNIAYMHTCTQIFVYDDMDDTHKIKIS